MSSRGGVSAQTAKNDIVLSWALQRIDAKLSCGGFSQIFGHIGALS
jgi:hypothetical protein